MTAPEIQKKLADFFPATSIGWLPAVLNKEKTSAIAFPYIDARDVMDRLDEAVGIGEWKDEYSVTTTGQVLCKLSVRIGGEWITKMDVGGQSDQENAGDKMKSAFSDALKRTAVKFGIGRYLYSFPDQWCAIDQYKRFKETPKIPARFLRDEDKTSAERKADAKPAAAAPASANPPSSAVPDKDVPKTGKALVERLGKADKDKTLKGILAFVANCGSLWGYPLDMSKWSGAQLAEAVSFGREFKRRLDEKVEMIREEQDAVIRGHAPEGDLTNLMVACKAAQVYAPDHMTAEEAKRVIGILEGK